MGLMAAVEILSHELSRRDFLFARRRSQRRQPPRRQYREVPLSQPEPPERGGLRLTRRQLIIGGGTFIAGTVLATLLRPWEVKYPSPNPYQNWERYHNSTFPAQAILEIGQDITNTLEYPDFKQAGELLVLSQKQPEILQQFIPLYAGSKPLQLRLTDLVRTAGAIARLNMENSGIGVDVKVRDRKSGKITNIVLVNFARTTAPLSIELDNSISFAPDIVKKLMIVKEISHLFFMRQHQDLIANEIISRFDIDTSNLANLATQLQANAYSEIFPKGVDFGDLYKNAFGDLDGAAHWYILPSFGKMKAQGLLSLQDLRVLSTNNRIFEAAKSSGLLIDQGQGTFVWQKGVGPFHPLWLTLVRPLWIGFSQLSAYKLST